MRILIVINSVVIAFLGIDQISVLSNYNLFSSKIVIQMLGARPVCLPYKNNTKVAT
ncbi:hypothetical protein MTBBW1_2200040 [Desulfamplus magnetovallimortis]|uniref:Uncharacterized protein n=1 Tax=Desulfamplus magnetovallimortis TaxID=1246637 RepID=A0A1W1HD70_9BACT|nr:hypothetical protein MTBBW1_2200040 [Desulfamplus magnetovallimortis]